MSVWTWLYFAVVILVMAGAPICFKVVTKWLQENLWG